MPFTFTAHGTNNQQIAATFNLQDGSNTIGTAVFGYTLGSSSTVFSNSAVIVINDTRRLALSVGHQCQRRGRLAYQGHRDLNRFTHTSPHDVSALVTVPPGS
jgi:hypothetical protein